MEIDITKDLYNCCPLLHEECTKENCYINNGPCRLTVDYEKSQEYLIEKKKSSDNLINELEKYIDEKNKIKVETDGYIWQLKRPSITCRDLKKKLQELKDSDKE